MATKRKQHTAKVDSVSGTLELASAIADREAIAWPVEIIAPAPTKEERELENAVFRAVIKTRTFRDWDEISIMNAARYSSHMAALLADEKILKEQTSLIPSPNNPKQRIRNPMLDIVTARMSAIRQIAQSLGISSMDNRTVMKSAKATNLLEHSFKEADNSDLLA